MPNIKATDDFNLSVQKKPRKSTLKKQLKLANTLVNVFQVDDCINEFDRLKFAVNLERYSEYIKFEIIYLKETLYPSLHPYGRYKLENKKLLRQKEKSDINFNDLDALDDDEIFNDHLFDEDNEYDDKDEISLDDITDGQECINNENSQVLSEKWEDQYDIYNTNYAIDYKIWRRLLGVNNIYIQNGFLVIDITGKFMASAGYLGKMHKNNIKECFQKLLDLNLIKFDIDKLYEVAQLYLCDVCIDIDCGISKKVMDIIDGVGSLLPISSDSYAIYKYKRTGLLAVKKAKDNGEILGMYYKGEELSYRNCTRYMNIIEHDGIEQAKRTLRIEYKLRKLENIRRAFNIKAKEYAIVRLMDVLESTEKPIIRAFNMLEAEPNKLRERIFGWIEKEPDIDNCISEKSLEEVLLAERYVEILKENNYDITKTKRHIKTEYSGSVSEDCIKKFNTLANSRNCIFNFLIYRRPKSVTRVLELLKKVYEYYGMELGGIGD